MTNPSPNHVSLSYEGKTYECYVRNDGQSTGYLVYIMHAGHDLYRVRMSSHGTIETYDVQRVTADRRLSTLSIRHHGRARAAASVIAHLALDTYKVRNGVEA